jgi:hypothetical protein
MIAMETKIEVCKIVKKESAYFKVIYEEEQMVAVKL